jgi:hypothetical protein
LPAHGFDNVRGRLDEIRTVYGDASFRFLDHYVLRVFDGLGIAAPGEPGLRWPG